MLSLSWFTTDALDFTQDLPLWNKSTRETLAILWQGDQFDMVLQSVQDIACGDVLSLEDTFSDLED